MGEYPAVYFLMGLTIAVFVLQLFAGNRDNAIFQYGVCDYRLVLQGEVWRLLTCHFLLPMGSSSLITLLLSLYILYIFGTELEGIYRTPEVLAFMIVTGLSITIFGTLAHLWKPNAFVGYYSIQGIVTGLTVLYACHFPTRRLMLMLVIPCPTWLVALLFTAAGFLTMPSAPVSALAAAGFALLYHRFQLRITNLSNFLPQRRRVGPQLHAPRAMPSSSSDVATDTELRNVATVSGQPDHDNSSSSVDEQLEAKLDLVLAKVSQQGRASLTADELALLNRASELYKKRRG